MRETILAKNSLQVVCLGFLLPLLALHQAKESLAFSAQWTHAFGKEFYLHEQPFSSLASMTKSDWELRIKGQLFETGKKLNVTGFDELKEYIMHELGGVMPQETDNGNLEQ